MDYGRGERDLSRETLKELLTTVPKHQAVWHQITKQVWACVVRLEDGRELAGACSYWGKNIDPEKSREMAYKKALFSLRNALSKEKEPNRRGKFNHTKTPNKT